MTSRKVRKVRVLIVDDSALIRQLLGEILRADPAIEVVGTAADAYAARDSIKRLNPDVLTLDVEMPKMDGIQFLRNLMRLRPMPVVMCSSLTEQGAAVTLDALALGAVDFVTKPKLGATYTLAGYAAELTRKVKMAATARPRAPLAPPLAAAMPTAGEGGRRGRPPGLIVAIGASTGGTEAIREILARLSPGGLAIVISQHIPKAFSGAFAARLNSHSALIVTEAEDGQEILAGHAYLAPGDRHLLVARDGARFRCRLDDGPVVQRHKPSVDVMFRSVAASAGANAIGVVLTGMGRDGADGLLAMRAAGAACIAQDEASSVVWGMPGAAVAAGAVDSLHPLAGIAARIGELESARRGARDAAA